MERSALGLVTVYLPIPTPCYALYSIHSLLPTTHIWLQKGYECFAAEGPSGLKVERLAATTGISKSSFYNHFADLGLFQEALPNHHLAKAREIVAKEQKARSIIPDLLQEALPWCNHIAMGEAHM
jgi:hypothetical protein